MSVCEAARADEWPGMRCAACAGWRSRIDYRTFLYGQCHVECTKQDLYDTPAVLRRSSEWDRPLFQVFPHSRFVD